MVLVLFTFLSTSPPTPPSRPLRLQISLTISVRLLELFKYAFTHFNPSLRRLSMMCVGLCSLKTPPPHCICLTMRWLFNEWKLFSIHFDFFSYESGNWLKAEGILIDSILLPTVLSHIIVILSFYFLWNFD